MKDANYKAQISFELSLLLEFFEKSALAEPTPYELQVFKQTGDRIRELFAELGKSSKAA